MAKGTTSRKRGRPKKVSLSSTTASPVNQTKESIAMVGTVKVTEVAEELEVVTEGIREEQSPKSEVQLKDPKVDTQLWVDVICGNRIMKNDKALLFVAPKIINGKPVVEIEEDDVATKIRFWETSLIMYAIGGNLSMNVVKNYMMKEWNFVKLPEMFYNDEGYFILKFKTEEDHEAVLLKGPYTIRNMPMVIMEWRPDFLMERDMMRTIPLWVKFPQLPIQMWGERSLGEIGSVIGMPLFTDECTAGKLRVTYAQILVEVDITQ